MAVYVDNMAAKFRNMVMCHMIADTTEELLEMANKIGVNVKWVQDFGTYLEHFDISQSKRNRACRFGAIKITMKQLGRMTCSRPGSPLREHLLKDAGIVLDDPINDEMTDEQKQKYNDFINISISSKIKPIEPGMKVHERDLFNGSE